VRSRHVKPAINRTGRTLLPSDVERKSLNIVFADIGQWRCTQMADDKSKQDNRDRSKVSSSEEYEVQYLMTKYDLSRNRALELIIKHNRSRKEIERELDAVDI
jgi:Protein of unknown function (DUF3606)